MSNITLEGIAAVIREELKPISERLETVEDNLGSIKTTQDQHTAALVGLATDMKKVLDEKTVSAARLERLEHWAAQVGSKLGIKLVV